MVNSFEICANCYRSVPVNDGVRTFSCARCIAPACECAVCTRISAERGLTVLDTCAACSFEQEQSRNEDRDAWDAGFIACDGDLAKDYATLVGADELIAVLP